MRASDRACRLTSIFAAIFSLSICISGSARAATAYYRDGVFNDSDWTLTVEATNPTEGGVAAYQASTGGLPCAYRYLNLVVCHQPTATETSWGFSMRNDAMYAPGTQGALSSIRFDADIYEYSGYHIAYGPALSQSGKFYYFAPFSTVNWSHVHVESVVATDFRTAVDANDHPDFSATGLPIRFGFVSSHTADCNSTGWCCSGPDGGIDNWTVTVDPVAPYVPPISSGTPIITATAGAHGTITPDGAVSVNCGADQTFAIVPDPSYRIADVQVDGASVGAVASYPFMNVMDDHTISASFATGCLTPPAGMVAWWPLDEGYGPTAIDIIGSAHGGLGGGAAYVAGQVASAVRLGTSTADYVAVADNPALDFGTGSFSIDAWVRTLDAGTSVRTIVDKRGSGIGYSMFISFGHLGLQIADASGFANFTTPSGALTDGNWHHVAATVDRAGGATGGTLYMDGVAALTFDPTGRAGSISNDGALHLGQPGIAFNGDIDEVGLFSRALTLTEVSQVYQAGSFGKCKSAVSCVAPPSDMVAWWALDEPSGRFTADLIVPRTNGTLVGNSTRVPGRVAGAVRLATSTSDLVTVADDPTLDFGAGSFSIDGWVRTLDAGTSVRTILDKRGTGGIGYSLFISFGRLGLQIADATGATNFTPLPNGNLTDGNWHHVAATVDRAGGATGGNLYVDGVMTLNFNPTVRPNSISNDGALRLGQPGIAFNGDIDEVELFSRALTGTEVSQIQAAGSFGNCKPTILVSVADQIPAADRMLAMSNNPLRDGPSQIRFNLAREQRVEIRILDISGRVVRRIEPGLMPAGEQQIPWNGTADDGQKMPAGVYLVNVRFENGIADSRKIVIIR